MSWPRSNFVLSPRKLIAVSIYELIFSPLLLATVPRTETLLRWLFAAGVGLGAVGLYLGIAWWRAERRARRRP